MSTFILRTEVARESQMRRMVTGPTREDPVFARLRKSSTMLVPGVGNILGRVVVCGEAPGDEEDRTGLPFVGPAGVLLTAMLRIAGLEREEIWITNLVKYRPTDSRGQIRRPTHTERLAGARYLRRELNVIRPEAVVLCGGTVLQAICPGASVSRVHGKAFEARSPGRFYFPVMHPAACLRNPEWERWTRADFAELPKLLRQIPTSAAASS